MLIIMRKDARKSDVDKLEKTLSAQGIRSERLISEKQVVISIIGGASGLDVSVLSMLGGVQEVVRLNSPVRLASRDHHPEDTVITFSDGTKIGGLAPTVVIAGPCSVESADQLRRTAEFIRSNGVRFLRGG